MSDFFKTFEQRFNLLNSQAFEANRSGEITAAQQKQVTSTMNWKRIILLILAMLAVGGLFGFIFFAAFRDNSWQNNLKDMQFVIFLGGILFLFILYMGFAILTQFSRAMKIRRDLANRAIRQGQGQLVHGKKGYSFEMGGTHLRMPADQSGGLLPGAIYQIYYLDESGVLLSATASYPVNTAQAQTALNEILASSHRFSAEDLLANKQGEVTFAQRRKLFPNILLGASIMLFSLLFLLPFLFNNHASSNLSESLFALLCVIGVIAVVQIMGAVILTRALLDFLSPNLEQAQGRVLKERRVVNTGKSSHVEYNYVINKLRFQVNYQAYTALVDGLQYRIYYLPRTKKLIAIEALV